MNSIFDIKFFVKTMEGKNTRVGRSGCVNVPSVEGLTRKSAFGTLDVT